MRDYKVGIENSSGKVKKQSKKKMRKLEPNLDTLLSGVRNPMCSLPDDFFSNPRQYRKDNSEISQ
jgi:hypothetical protein